MPIYQATKHDFSTLFENDLHRSVIQFVRSLAATGVSDDQVAHIITTIKPLNRQFKKLWCAQDKQIGRILSTVPPEEPDFDEEHDFFVFMKAAHLVGLPTDVVRTLVYYWYNKHDLLYLLSETQMSECLTLMLHTAANQVRKIKNEMLLKQATKSLSKTKTRVLDALQTHGAMTAGQLSVLLGVDRRAIWMQLKRMTSAGELDQINKGLYTITVSDNE